MSRAGYNPKGAIQLQETFLRLSKGQNTNWLTGLFASHPPSQERVDANKATALKLNAKGEIKQKIYQQKTAHLRKTAPAYKNYENAVLLLKKKEYKQSLRLLDKAIAIEPKEAFFHGTKGDIFFKKQQFNSALNAYDRAIYLNHNYFYFYERRGLVHKQLGNQQTAMQDFKKSSDLLPTAISYKELGQLALNQGDTVNAKQYFLKASSSKSTAGKSALISFIKLDVSQNPQKYIQVRWKKNTKNTAAFTIYNVSPLPLYNISLKANFYNDKGKKYYVPINLNDAIGPKKAIVISIGNRTIRAEYQHTIKIDVVSAKIL
jgi:tetratricopeptide (TPR) repeat protein